MGCSSDYKEKDTSDVLVPNVILEMSVKGNVVTPPEAVSLNKQTTMHLQWFLQFAVLVIR